MLGMENWNTHVLGTVRVLSNQSEVLARGEALETQDVDFVIRADLVIVGGVSEGQGKHTLLLQVGLVNTGKGADDNSKSTKEARL